MATPRIETVSSFFMEELLAMRDGTRGAYGDDSSPAAAVPKALGDGFSNGRLTLCRAGGAPRPEGAGGRGGVRRCVGRASALGPEVGQQALLQPAEEVEDAEGEAEVDGRHEEEGLEGGVEARIDEACRAGEVHQGDHAGDGADVEIGR